MNALPIVYRRAVQALYTTTVDLAEEGVGGGWGGEGRRDMVSMHLRLGEQHECSLCGGGGREPKCMMVSRSRL